MLIVDRICRVGVAMLQLSMNSNSVLQKKRKDVARVLFLRCGRALSTRRSIIRLRSQAWPSVELQDSELRLRVPPELDVARILKTFGVILQEPSSDDFSAATKYD